MGYYDSLIRILYYPSHNTTFCPFYPTQRFPKTPPEHGLQVRSIKHSTSRLRHHAKETALANSPHILCMQLASTVNE